MEIIFDPPKNIVRVPEMRTTISTITIMEMTDSPERKSVYAMTRELGRIILWEGAAYDAIGQWTDADVENRINELYQ